MTFERPRTILESLKKIFVCGHAKGKRTPGCARVIVRNFASQAFRRPASAKEVDEYVKYVSFSEAAG